MEDNFNVKRWKKNKLMEEFGGKADRNAIPPQHAITIWNFLQNYLDNPAKEAGLRMSTFEQEFPTATSFISALENIDMAGDLNESGHDSIEKIEITYTERTGKFYKMIVTKNGKEFKVTYDQAVGVLDYLNVEEDLPQVANYRTTKTLDSIVKQLEDQAIEASWDDNMDVS